MKYLQEVTDWGSHNVPNHIYYLNDEKTKMVGYIRAGTKTLFKFKKPMGIDIRGRKFIELKDRKAEKDEVYFGKKKAEVKPNNAIEVQGSNGKVYLLTKNVSGSYTCTCPGFTFRHTCKHISGVK
jgi:queuine/archaeosine tRNA-ribosyltransferase